MLGKVYTEVRNNILNHIYKYSEKVFPQVPNFEKGGGVHTLVYILSILSKRGYTPSKILTRVIPVYQACVLDIYRSDNT